MSEKVDQTAVPPRVNVLGVGVHAVHPQLAVDLLENAVAEGRKGYVCVTGVHGVMESQEDEALRRIHNESLLTVPDGMPTVWVGRLAGQRAMRRTYGPDLMVDVCEQSVATGRRHFFYGGKEGVADELRDNLQKRFPGLIVVGTYCPPFRPLSEEEEADLAARIGDLQPDYLWVGLSTPKQERFMASHRELDVKVMLGVGAAFDLHTGRMVDAPDWMKAMGLQWLHRLCQEPTRLARRYLINNPRFLWKIALQLCRIRHYKLDPLA